MSPMVDEKQFYKGMFKGIWYNAAHGDIKNAALDGFLISLVILWEVFKVGFLVALVSMPLWLGAVLK